MNYEMSPEHEREGFLQMTCEFGLFFAGGTINAHRKRGAYTALVSARIEYAKTLGYQFVGLFAKEDSSAPIVAKHGFRRCGDMIYWKRDPSYMGRC